MKSTCPNDICTMYFPHKEIQLFFVLNVYVHNILLACNYYILVFQDACPNRTFTCPWQSGKCLFSTLIRALLQNSSLYTFFLSKCLPTYDLLTCSQSVPIAVNLQMYTFKIQSTICHNTHMYLQ